MSGNPQLRFLLRATLLLVALLALWGVLLLDPLRAGLRAFTAVAIWLIPGDGSVAEATIEPNGDWSLRLPVPAAVARQAPVQTMFGRVSSEAAPVKVRSLKLVVEGKYPVLFTAGLPFFWALILASGWTWQRGRMLLKGSSVLLALAAASLLFYILRTAIKNLHLVASAPANFVLTCGEYFVVNVVPYLAPLLLALYLDRELRARVFTWQLEDADPTGPTRSRKKKVRQLR